MKLGKLKEELESNQPSCPIFYQFTVWSENQFGVTNHQGPAKRPPGQKSACKGEGKYINDFREIIMCMFILGKSITTYVKYSI